MTTKNDNSRKKIDVLVAGAGPTGLVIATELARRGVSFRIIDTERGPTDKSKAIGIQSRTMEVFYNMGLAAQFESRGLKMKAATLYDDGKKIMRVPFEELNNRFPFLLMIPQTDTEQILLSALDQYGAVVERETSLISFTQDENQVTAELQHHNGQVETVTAKWLVGCDGAHSTVRHHLNIPFEGSTYEDGFHLADVQVDWSLSRDEFHLMIHKGWLLAAFPLPGSPNRFRLLIDAPADQADRNKTPRLEEIQALVDERSHVKAVLSNPNWMANYRIHRRIVSHLRENRVFLAGDAAHIHSPAAAQGMNTGIQDVFNLAWKLALVANGHSPDSILDSYNAERYPVEKDVLQRTDVLLKMVQIKNPILMKIRDLVAQLVLGFHPVNKRLVNQISELAVEYHNSPIVRGVQSNTVLRAGQRFPDAIFIDRTTGSVKRIFEMLQDGKHLLLFFAGNNDAQKTLLQITGTIKSYPAGQINICLVSVDKDQKIPDEIKRIPVLSPVADPGMDYLFDNDFWICLIRPDGYIGFSAGARHAAEKLDDYLPVIFNKIIVNEKNLISKSAAYLS